MKVISKEEAFAIRGDEKNIPIKDEKTKFEFTKKWFKSRNQTTWSTFLAPRFDGSKPIHVVQIGVFEGMDLVWLMQNCCRHPSSRVIAIDPWLATTKLSKEYMEECHKRAIRNLRQWRNQVTIIRGKSQEELEDVKTNWADLIIIDGDHDAIPVLKDAKESLRICKTGGLMVFDDVRNRTRKKDHVIDGLRMFLEQHDSDVKLEFQHRFVDAYTKVT